MDYTAKLKKILSQEQLRRIQSFTATIRSIMDQALFKHSIGTLKYCIKMADIYLGTGINGGDTALDNCNAVSNTGRGAIDGFNVSAENRKEETRDKYYMLAAAAILHDYGKVFSFEELRGISLEQQLPISDFE